MPFFRATTIVPFTWVMVVKEDANILKGLMEQTVKPRVLALLRSEEFFFQAHTHDCYPAKKNVSFTFRGLSLLIKLSNLRARTSALS
jgi:hypothetical protein